MVDELYRAPPWRFDDAESRRALYRWWVRDPLRGLRYAVPFHAMRLLPTDRVSDIGARLGGLQATKRAEASARAAALLRELRPEASAAEINALVVAHWRHVGRVIAELPVLHRLWPEGRIEVQGFEHVEAARAAGRPRLVAGLHVGNWEVVHAGLSALRWPGVGVYQRLPNRFLMRLMDSARQRSWRDGVQHGRLAPHLGAVFDAHRALAAPDGGILYYVDEYWQGRVHAPALGRPLAMKGNIMRAVRLASATGAAVIPAYALRLGEGPRFRLTFLPEVPIGPPGRGRAAILDDIAALDAAIEPVVRAHPEQWFMLHAFRPDR
jgi:KDO2-lipid IV(A) lauroyltransferase